MIVSENITLNIKKPFNDNDIEKELKSKGINALRWAVVDVDSEMLTLSVSYVK